MATAVPAISASRHPVVRSDDGTTRDHTRSPGSSYVPTPSAASRRRAWSTAVTTSTNHSAAASPNRTNEDGRLRAASPDVATTAGVTRMTRM
ncbi:hypothetical protein DJ80_04645 [Halorubrum ezzemoulense]|uniref:Uncharacterized protein n=1 Tax=Halorubrum ezzemoulense TaxID=337243 RepID=A0A256J758_HALEZ|nr:hypothetical protein DJ80_04645 [Halorubrum ezzemoulense]